MAYVEMVESKKALRIGLNAIINIFFDKELEGVYKTNVLDFNSDKKIIFLSIPSQKGKFVPIPKGVRMTVNLFDGSTMYEFDTISLGVVKIDNLYSVPVPYPDTFRKIERRAFIRLPLFISGMLKHISGENEEIVAFSTKNISAGGLMIVTKKLLKLGDIIYVNLDLEPGLSLKEQKCKVVRVDEMQETGYQYGLQFIDLPQQVETKLVRFIFQKELKIKNVKK